MPRQVEGGHIAAHRKGCKRLCCSLLIGFIYPARDGPCEGRGRKFADPCKRNRFRAFQLDFSGRQHEQGVSVKRSENRPDGTGKTGECHLCDAMRFSGCQRSIRRDAGNRRVLARLGIHLGIPPFFRIAAVIGRRAVAAEFIADFIWPGPEDRRARHEHRAEAVHPGQGADCDPVRCGQRGRPKPAGMGPGIGPKAAADIAERETGGTVLIGFLAKLAIGRLLAPSLVAAIGKVIENRSGDDRCFRDTRKVFQPKAAPIGAQPGRDTICGCQTISAASGEHDSVDLLDHRIGTQKIGLTCARSATSDCTGGSNRGVCNNNSRSGQNCPVLGISDFNAAYIRDQVPGAGL